MKKILFILFSLFLLIYCTGKKVTEDPLKTIFDFPKKLSEVSGMVVMDSLIWVIEDSGNEAEVYGLDSTGKITTTISLTGITNKDWEDLTKDASNNLYIGDFGNNGNIRKDLCIYKLNAGDLSSTEVQPSEIIRFYYPDQTDFPPKKSALFYDCEAFFELNGFFYLFTKNRSKGFDGTTYVYKVPNKQGTHAAQLMGTYQTCDTFNSCAITSAAVSSDGKKVVLLSHSKLWLFEEFIGDDFLRGKIKQVELHHVSQKESVSFKNHQTLLIADERANKIGGQVYEFILP